MNKKVVGILAGVAIVICFGWYLGTKSVYTVTYHYLGETRSLLESVEVEKHIGVPFAGKDYHVMVQGTTPADYEVTDSRRSLNEGELIAVVIGVVWATIFYAAIFLLPWINSFEADPD